MNGRMRRLIRKHFRYSNKVEKCYTSISAFTICIITIAFRLGYFWSCTCQFIETVSSYADIKNRYRKLQLQKHTAGDPILATKSAAFTMSAAVT